ncbi:MAG: glycosyltransferase family 39 protein [Anaerolineae bacterium]
MMSGLKELRILRHHWPLVVVLGLFLCLATTFSCFLPLGEAADETDHFALVRFVAEHGRPPLTIAERNAIGPKGDASPLYHALVTLLSQHVDLTALPKLPYTQANPKRLIPTDGFKANRVFHTEDELFPWRGVVLAWHLARLVSVPLGAITVIAAYLTTSSLVPHRHDLATAAAAFVAFLPRFLINSAVVSDDALVVPLVALSVYVMVRIAQGSQKRRTFLLLGLLVGLAAVAKYHGLILLPEATLLCIVLAWGNAMRSATPRQVWLAWLRCWAWMMVAFVLTAGWWFAFLIVRFNQVAELGWVRGLIAPFGDPVLTTGLSRLFETPIGATTGGTFSWNEWASLLFRSFWLTYGWLHIFAPTWVYWLLGIWAVLAAAGLGGRLVKYFVTVRGQASQRVRLLDLSTWRWDIVIPVFHLLTYLCIIMIRQASRPARETAQGRHLYPALTALAFFVTYGLSVLPDGIRNLVRSTRLRIATCRDEQRTAGRTCLPLWSTLWLFSLPSALLMLSVVALPSIILPNYLPYLSIRSLNPKEAPVGHRFDITLVSGLKFLGYDLPTSSDAKIPSFEIGTGIPITLHWYADAAQTRDYLVRLCLEDAQLGEMFCSDTHPLDGRYPVRAWEAGYWIRDEITIPTPACLSEGIYALRLELLPLQMDSAATLVDTKSSRGEPVSLGHVSLRASARETVSLPHVEVWTAQGPLHQASLQVQQLRQGFTVFVREATSANVEEGSSLVRLVAQEDPARKWGPVASYTVCRLPGGEAVTAHSFIVDASVRPGEYRLQMPEGAKTDLLVQVATRWRNFDVPSHLATHRETITVGCGEVAPAPDPCIELLHYELERSPRWPGESVLITAHWRSHRTMSQPYTVVFYLLDHMAHVGGQLKWSLGGHYPNVLWVPGEYVSETYRLSIYPHTPPGLYTIQLGLYEYIDDHRGSTYAWLPLTSASLQTSTDRLYLGQIRVRDLAEGSMPFYPLQATLGGQIQLLGYDLLPPPDASLLPGQTLHLTLYWQALQPPEDDYTVFAQLIGPDGLIWGQQDNQPQGGRYPTSQWELNQTVVDRYLLTLRPDAPRGTYRLLVGMYLLASGQRLSAVLSDGTHLPDNAIFLARLYVE